MAKPSIYAVARGRACGLFTSWQECEKQIKGYPGARYKGFADVAAALAWLNGETNAATAAPNNPAGRITISAWPKETPIVSTTTHIAAVAAEIGEAEIAI